MAYTSGEGVGRGDLPVIEGVVDHRGEEVHRLHQGFTPAVEKDARIIEGGVIHQDAAVTLAPRQTLQRRAQVSRTQL
jgi:hypothetical protein